jgi:hypothetical protein
MQPTPASITQRIPVIRGARVMLDRDLEDLYGVETRGLVQAVKRHAGRSRNFVLYWRMMTNYRIHIGHRREVRFLPLP